MALRPGFLGNPRRLATFESEVEPRPADPWRVALPAGEAFGQAGPNGGFDPVPATGGVADAAADAEVEPHADVRILSNGFQLEGQLKLGRFGRLSDCLNLQSGFVQLTEARLLHPGQGDGEAAGDRGRLWVRLDQVVVVSEREPPPGPRASSLYVQKVQRRVTIVTPGYTLRGLIHMLEAATMESFVEAETPRFIPMTDLVVRSLVDQRPITRQPFALVNRSQIISMVEEQARAERTVDQPEQQPTEAPAPREIRVAAAGFEEAPAPARGAPGRLDGQAVDRLSRACASASPEAAWCGTG